MYPTRRRVARSAASNGRPKSDAVPSVDGKSPVNIFIVVVLPHPLEPRKPKISPRTIPKLTWSTAVNEPKRLVKPRASIATGVSPRDVGAG